MDKENNHRTKNMRRQLGSCRRYSICMLNKESDAEHKHMCQKVAGSRRDKKTEMPPEKKSSIISTMLGLTILAGMARAVPMESAMESSHLMEEMMCKSAGCFDIGNENFTLLTSASKSKWSTTLDTSDAEALSSSGSEDEVK